MVESLAFANENCLNLDVDDFLFLVHYQVSNLQWAYGRWLNQRPSGCNGIGDETNLLRNWKVRDKHEILHQPEGKPWGKSTGWAGRLKRKSREVIFKKTLIQVGLTNHVMITYVIQSINPWTRTLATNCYKQIMKRSSLCSSFEKKWINPVKSIQKLCQRYVGSTKSWRESIKSHSAADPPKRWIFLVILSTRMFSPLQHWKPCLLRFPGFFKHHGW